MIGKTGNRLGPAGVWRHTELEVIQTIKRLNAATVHMIAAELNLHIKWLGQKLVLLKRANRIYISDWQKKNLKGPPRKMYSLRLADEEDMPKPPPISGSQKTKNYVLRKQLAQQLNLTRPQCQTQVEHQSQTCSASTST